MQKEVFCAPTVYNPVRYVQGLKTTGGTIVWIAGQVSQDKDGKVVHKGDFPGQARQALANLKAMVEAAGGTIQDIVKVNTYLTDLRYREELARIRAEFLPDGKLPVSKATCRHALRVTGSIAQTTSNRNAGSSPESISQTA